MQPMLLLLVLSVAGGTKVPEDILPTPRVSIGWVAEHQALVPADQRHDWRYLIAPADAPGDWVGAVSVALNIAIAREGVVYKPTVIANGWGIAIDFKQLISDHKIRSEVLHHWDRLALKDPYYHVPSINSGLKTPVVAAHLPPDQVQLIVNWSDQAKQIGVIPIFRADFAFCQMLAAHEGIFYQLRGVKFGKNERGWTEEEQWLADRGHFQATAARLKSDRRKATFQSGVTGYPRSVVALKGLIGRAWITEDSLGDVNRHPIHNLLPDAAGRLKCDAKELIADLPNGMHDFLLTDGNGKVQSKAAITGVDVRDITVPAPYPAILQPAISCIRCHWRGTFQVGEQSFGFDGLRPVANDVQVILAPHKGVDILELKKGEALRLAGLYGGGLNFDRNLQLGRSSLSLSVQYASGLSVGKAGETIATMFGSYRYVQVGSERALLEIGIRCKEGEDADQKLAALMTPLDNPDPTLLALMAGLSVRREDWERIYHDVYLKSLGIQNENDSDSDVNADGSK